MRRKRAEYEKKRTMMIYVLCTTKNHNKTKIRTGKEDNSPGSVTINTVYRNQ